LRYLIEILCQTATAQLICVNRRPIAAVLEAGQFECGTEV